MIARHGGKPRRARRAAAPGRVATRQSMSVGSDGDESGASDEERGGYSDGSEPELEAGCMGVRDPREQKREKDRRTGWLRTALFALLFCGAGAFLPFLLDLALDTVLAGEGTDAAGGRGARVAGPPRAAGAAAGAGADAPNRSLAPVPLAAMPGAAPALAKADSGARRAPHAGGVTAWGATSSKTKEALKTLIAAGTIRLEPLWLEEELEGGRVVFASGEGSCTDVCNAGGKDWMCTPEWFAFLNHCEVLQAAFPAASDCLLHLYGRDLPAFSASLGTLAGSHVMINTKPDKYPSACQDVGDHTQRLCACRKRVETEAGTDMNGRVSKVVIRQLRELEGQIAKGAAGKPSVHGSINEFWAAHAPAGLIQDIKSGRNTFLEAPRGTNCFDACISKNLACQRHWFDVLNNCAALQAAFPEHKACSADFYGRDLPAYRPEDSTLLVNKEPKTYAASCGGRHSKTRRLCGCGERKGPPAKATTFHTVYNVEPSQYFEWQVRYMHYWFRQSGTPGSITRLLSAGGKDYLAQTGEIPTHVSAPYKSPLINDAYKPYNKPWSITKWLEEAKPTEEVIMIVDPDCMFVKRMEIMVEEGSPVAQQAFYNFDFSKDDVPMQLARRYCKDCTFLDPIAVPVIIHRKDIQKIAPRWLEKTLEIRRDRGNWLPAWTNTSQSPVGLAWTAEMFGYVFAASELGIRHEIWDLQNVPPVHKELFTSIIHYHVEIPLPNKAVWYKHADNAGYNIPWPLPPGTDEVTTIALTHLHDAYVHLGKGNHSWPNSNRYSSETRRRRRHVRRLAAWGQDWADALSHIHAHAADNRRGWLGGPIGGEEERVSGEDAAGHGRGLGGRGGGGRGGGGGGRGGGGGGGAAAAAGRVGVGGDVLNDAAVGAGRRVPAGARVARGLDLEFVERGVQLEDAYMGGGWGYQDSAVV